MNSSRRDFLRAGGVVVLGSLMPSWVPRALASGSTPKVGRTLVVLFQRGAVDGLSMVPPVGDPAYAVARPGLAVPRQGAGAALRLDDLFGLHPALASLLPWYQQGRLAIVQEAGLMQVTRSHFDAQDWMESGRLAQRGDGVLNRALAALRPLPGESVGSESPPSPSPFQGVALQPNMPLILAGSAPALALASLEQFRLRGGGQVQSASSFESMYAGAVDAALRVSGSEAFDALAKVNQGGLAHQPPRHGARYPSGPVGQRLQDIARLIHADVGLTIAVTEVAGWDTHVNQKPQLETRLKELGDALAAFAQDLGPRLDDVCTVSLTEFGRTVKENGTRGTDHGRASAFFILGGGVKGGRVLTGSGGWRGLEPQHLFESRDLDVRWDYRCVLASLLENHLALPAASRELVFPGLGAAKLPNLFG